MQFTVEYSEISRKQKQHEGREGEVDPPMLIEREQHCVHFVLRFLFTNNKARFRSQ